MKKIIVFIIISLSQITNADEAFSFKSTNGTEYKQCTVKGYTLDGVKISHSTGFATVPYEELPAEVAEKIGYDETFKKKLAEARKRRSQQQYASAERQKQAQKIQELKESAEKHRIKVIQVLEGGVLADKMESYVISSSMASIGGGGGVASGGYRRTGEVYFYENVRGVAEGDSITILAAKQGVYTYKDVSGASRTVHKWIAFKPDK